jgi:hypothetical protein
MEAFADLLSVFYSPTLLFFFLNVSTLEINKMNIIQNPFYNIKL